MRLGAARRCVRALEEGRMQCRKGLGSVGVRARLSIHYRLLTTIMHAVDIDKRISRGRRTASSLEESDELIAVKSCELVSLNIVNYHTAISYGRYGW